MKIHILRAFIISTLFISAMAVAGDKAPSSGIKTEMSAKMAQMKARMRAYEADMTDENTDPYKLSSLDSAGCDINIGNVVLDNGSESPNEVVVLIDGDVIQSNNCR
jgi:hypothetical protein